jgi:hypothetical protein
MNTMTTWSPGTRSGTSSPTSSTTPADSWPSAIGIGRGRSPLMTDRSEWHSPAAAIRTSTSPRPGPSSSTVATRSGLLAAYGAAAPMRSNTAALIFMVPPPSVAIPAAVPIPAASRRNRAAVACSFLIRLAIGVHRHIQPNFAEVLMQQEQCP